MMYIEESSIMLLIKAIVVIVGGIIVLISVRTKGKLLFRVPFILIGIAVALFGLFYFK
ncbi:MAG: hypothetical protein J6I46_05060 [Ruminococcus sp.]|nr:hypothetical protein [Ruminococcus sp.]